MTVEIKDLMYNDFNAGTARAVIIIEGTPGDTKHMIERIRQLEVN